MIVFLMLLVVAISWTLGASYARWMLLKDLERARNRSLIKADQLDMQCEQARRAVAESFTQARRRTLEWLPLPCPEYWPDRKK